ncbi:MAG: PH domain-containing protein, partial [Wenzhouxiangellaceae bacterium]|nr:PH domain-containing protein [Wenzhouxiangellaceae bacterium]
MSAADGDAGWKALPVAAVGALYVNGIQRFVRENLVMFFGAGTGFAALDSLGWREFALFVALALSIGLLIAVIYHRRFRYQVDGEAVRVRQGLFEQKELKVRFERVQNIGFSQPIYLRPFGLTRVQLETPGAAQTEVRLPGIRTAEAEAIRDRISGRAGAVPFTD